MEVLARINSRFASLSPSEQRVASYVQSHADEIVTLSLGALASRCDTSDATVVRFCRSLGYSGFQDMKSTFIPELLRRGTSSHPELQGNDPGAAYYTRLVEDVRQTIQLSPASTMVTVARTIANSRRNVLIGLAGSAGVARIFGDSLSSIGLTAICLSDRVEIERMCESLGPGDVVFGISHSGETPEVYDGVGRGRSRGATAVGMTNYSPSSLAGRAEHVLLTSAAENLLGSYSCHPRVLELVVLELLCARIADQLRKEAATPVTESTSAGARNAQAPGNREGGEEKLGGR